MAQQSVMIPLGTVAPQFELPDVVSGRTVSLDALGPSQGLLVMFISRHCPYVQNVKAELARLGRDYEARGVDIVAISSNDVIGYPEDAPDRLAAMVREEGFTFPVLFDESQEVARSYSAACTPDLFLFDADRRLVYRGQLDDSRPGKGSSDGRDLRAALDAILGGRAVSPAQRPSVGCSIKWK